MSMKKWSDSREAMNVGFHCAHQPTFSAEATLYTVFHTLHKHGVILEGNVKAAQQAFYKQAKLNSAACKAQYIAVMEG